jgi:hypothetical protein
VGSREAAGRLLARAIGVAMMLAQGKDVVLLVDLCKRSLCELAAFAASVIE